MNEADLSDIAVNQHDLFSDHDSDEGEPSEIQMLAARKVALDLLNTVLRQKQALDHALDQDRGFKVLPSRDKAFCRMVVSTTLRRLGQIDDLIARAENKPGSTHPVLSNILRMGVAQILFMEVPDHAAVDTSVRLTDAVEMDRQKGFVNGVLRTITRQGREWADRQDEARLNTPEWLLKLWIEDYGLRPAAQISQANMAEAPLDITIKDEADRNFWAANFKATQMVTGTLRCLSGGAVTDMQGFYDGTWWVQDASAAIPARLFGDVSGRHVIDLCAAPGGKTMQLASMGARVTALDRSAKRLKRLEENLERIHVRDQVDVVVSDAAVWKPTDAPDMILLDAPCSATGTIRRHPDVPHLKTPRDIERLQDVQAAILDNAFRILKPSGTLVYCTCSIQKSEGEDQIMRLFELQDTAYKIPITAEELGGFDDAITDHGDLRILPYHNAALGGMDGFFISRITKKV